MRALLLLAMGVAVAIVAYVCIHNDEPTSPAPNMISESVLAPTSAEKSATQLASIRPVTRTTMQAPATPATQRVVPASPKKSQQVARRIKASRKAPAALPVAPDLKPATADSNRMSAKNSTLVASAGGKQRNFSDPMKDRWIGSLSGQKASLSMGKESIDRDCQKTARGCEDFSGPREARVIGVVMESDRVVSAPGSALDGQLVRGHYQRNTPAVYLK